MYLSYKELTLYKVYYDQVESYYNVVSSCKCVRNLTTKAAATLCNLFTNSILNFGSMILHSIQGATIFSKAVDHCQDWQLNISQQ